MHRAQTKPARPLAASLVCSLLLLCFGVISYSAALRKNATIDEPTHAMSGWLALRQRDFRVETVNPPLWKCWAALGNVLANPPVVYSSPIWNNRTWDPAAEVIWSSRILYTSPGFNGAGFVNRARAMMLLLSIALGGLIAWWSFKIAGSVAAIVATALFCFDPTYIAQAPLVKSDVAFSLAYLSLAFSVWRLGQRVTFRTLLGVALLCGAAINIKFSGVIVGPLLAILLLIRAVMKPPWQVFGIEVSSRSSRLLMSVAVGLCGVLGCVVLTWACYGFRFRPAPQADVQMNLPAIYQREAVVETTLALHRRPTSQEVLAHQFGSVNHCVRWADEHHALPQAMLAGFLYQYTCVQSWPAFLDGDYYGTGRWSYFPLAFLYKTPVAELAAIGIAVLVLIAGGLRKFDRVRSIHADASIWTVACLLVPFSVFAIASLSSHLNIGLRNALPIFPMMFIAVGIAAARSWRRRPRTTATICALLGIVLVCETLAGWPDYIAFFNHPTGGTRGGLQHLADSNLDWGQDVKSLAQWQQSQQATPLYAKLYLSVDARYYGLDFHPLEISARGSPMSDQAITSGYIAVSATHLQGLYTKPWEARFYQQLRMRRPVAVIGGTIYVFRVAGDKNLFLTHRSD